MDDSNCSPDLFLARRAAAGHQDAWAQIVETYGRRIFNVAFQFTSNREDAEDLTQEIFVRLHEGLKSYRGESPLAGWALRLSRNLCIDRYRQTRREKTWQRVAQEVIEQIPSGIDIEAQSDRRRTVEELYAALARLPEEFSEPVLLCDLQGWSIEEVAAYTGRPVGTVKSRLNRGRARLAESIRSMRSTPRLAVAHGGGA